MTPRIPNAESIGKCHTCVRKFFESHRILSCDTTRQRSLIALVRVLQHLLAALVVSEQLSRFEHRSVEQVRGESSVDVRYTCSLFEGSSCSSNHSKAHPLLSNFVTCLIFQILNELNYLRSVLHPPTNRWNCKHPPPLTVACELQRAGISS